MTIRGRRRRGVRQDVPREVLEQGLVSTSMELARIRETMEAVLPAALVASLDRSVEPNGTIAAHLVDMFFAIVSEPEAPETPGPSVAKCGRSEVTRKHFGKKYQ